LFAPKTDKGASADTWHSFFVSLSEMAAHPVLSEVDQVCKQLQEVINRRIAVALEKKKTGTSIEINAHNQ